MKMVNVCLATEIPDNEIEKHTNKPLKWQCYSQCKPLTIAEVNAIVTLKEEFQKPIKEVLHTLQVCDDGCPNEHFSKSVEASPNNDIYLDCYAVDREGHPLVCFNDSNCVSKLRILRAASTHYPVLRNFLHALYNAIKSNVHVTTIDNALCTGDFHSLMEITKIEGFDSLLKYESRYEQPTDIVAADSMLRNPNLESHLLLTHAKIIKDFEKEIEDFPEHSCCSCERLHQRKCVTKIKLSDKLSSEVWPRLTSFITQNVHVPGTLYICNYCKPLIKKNILPPRCVINGLQNISIPTEISKLDPLSMQLIQRAKCYQTVVRLSTYTAKVPIYNLLKACKGTMFFLPLPMNKTLETLKDSSINIAGKCWLPNPELFIIVNGKPTKGKVVWRNLVNVNHVKVAINKLKEINWLYKDITDDSVDEAAKQVIEVVNSTSSAMLEKATKDDIASFQAFTIRNLDSKLSTESDTDQYKVINIQEDPLDNRQKYLDVMCFPGLFPNGNFGEFHPHEKKISHSEYIKSRLLNKDSRFRKNAQYVFYLLWQKEMRELSAGVYNLLKSTRSQPVSKHVSK